MSLDNKVYVVGLCGQSGSGKTTIIELLNNKECNGYNIVIASDIIKSIYSDPSLTIYTPNDIITMISEDKENSDMAYNKYVVSQCELQLEFIKKIESRVFGLLSSGNNYILLSDRSPIDFYLYTICAINYINRVTGISPSDNVIKLIESMSNSSKWFISSFFDRIVIVPPHGNDVSNDISDSDARGARRTGLEAEFTGNNWYGNIASVSSTSYVCDYSDVFDRRNYIFNLLKDIAQ